ncbi:MAG: hypothetical protein AB1405_09140 [Bdellovibrionota bacterium]
MDDPSGILARTRKTLTVIWAAMLASTAIYGVVGYVVTKGREPPSPPPAAIIETTLAMVAAALAFASIFLHRVRLSPAALRKYLQAAGPEKTAAFLQANFTVVFALSESVAVFGLVLGILFVSAIKMIPYLVFGTVLIAFRMPASAVFEDLLKEEGRK